MADTTSDEFLENLIAVAPQHEQVFRTRDAIATQYCAERGLSKESLTIPQILEIRAMPEWQAAGD